MSAAGMKPAPIRPKVAIIAVPSAMPHIRMPVVGAAVEKILDRAQCAEAAQPRGQPECDATDCRDKRDEGAIADLKYPWSLPSVERASVVLVGPPGLAILAEQIVDGFE